MTVRPTTRRVKSRRDRIEDVLRYVLLMALALLFIIPFYVMVRNAVSVQGDITAWDWVWWPENTFDNVSTNLSYLFGDLSAPMDTGLKNSALIAVVQVIGQMVTASLAGYGLARIPYRWRDHVFYFILITLMVPSMVIFVPKYVVVSSMGWVNTLQGIMVPELFYAMYVFLFRQFYLDFPKELEDAGRVDGLGYFGLYRYIVLPNSKGIFMSLGVISFMYSWNAFLWPLVIGHTSDTWTVQIVLSTFLTAQTINLPALFMGATVGVILPIIVFLVMQRYIVEGVKLTGTKG
jgi:multiple sugar transport system permease protein